MLCQWYIPIDSFLAQYWYSRSWTGVTITPRSSVGYNYPLTAQQVQFSVTSTALTDVYLMYQTEYYKLQAGQPFAFLYSALGARTASGLYNNTAAISSNIMIVAVNPDSQNPLTVTVVQQSLVSAIVYYFPYYTWGIGATGGILFFLCCSTLFLMFLMLFTCLLYDCLDDDRQMKKRRNLQQAYHRIPDEKDFIQQSVNNVPQTQPKKEEIIIENIEQKM